MPTHPVERLELDDKVRHLNDTSELEIGIDTFREMLEVILRNGRASDEIALLKGVQCAASYERRIARAGDRAGRRG